MMAEAALSCSLSVYEATKLVGHTAGAVLLLAAGRHDLRTLAPVEYGSAAVTVTAEDQGGLTATQTFAVGVSDRLVRGVVGETLAGMARSHLASARMALGRRVTAGRTEASRLTVLGRPVPLGRPTAQTAAETAMETSALRLRLGLVELRRRLGAAGGGVEFGVRADAAWAELRTRAGAEIIDGQTAAVNQARGGVEASRPVRPGAVSLAPFGAAHVRRDGGAGQTGQGIEVAGGLRATAGKVRVDAQGRVLAVHSAAGYRERGVGLTLSVGNEGHEGLSLSVSPRWGDSAAGGGALWQDHVYRRYLPATARNDCRGSYGMRMPGGRLLTWFGSVGHSRFGRRFEVGGRVGVLE